MSALFSNIIFLNPWILAGLLTVPLLWFLLRITPPAPKRITLPTTRFLAGLVPDSQTPSQTPWWILLLRLLIAALVILALAHPVHNPSASLPGSGPVRVVIDNGWSAAQIWDKQIRAAQETAAQAGRENRDLYILTTANLPGKETPSYEGPLSAAQAEGILKALKPLPWPTDYGAALSLIDESTHQPLYSLWFSDGLEAQNLFQLAQKLGAQGGLSYISPAPENLPLALKLPDDLTPELQIAVNATDQTALHLPITLQALSEDGRILDRASLMLGPETQDKIATFDLPETLRNEVTQFRIAGRSGAGATFILDERFRKRAVGIIGADDGAETKPFIDALYYLTRALEPYTTIHTGNFDDILKQTPSVLILPDVSGMSADMLNQLEDWVKNGGTLLRFAGPNMAQAQGPAFLTPVPLRAGERSLSGSLSWTEAQKIEDFPESSPLYGIPIHEDITVKKQVLAEPVQDLDEKTWARLADGTPLITAAPLDKGTLILVHTTASPDWSDLALSGVYVEILRRVVSLSGLNQSANLQNSGALKPIWVFDGFGAVQSPDHTVRSIPASEFSDTMPDPSHPPGLYGRGGYNQALNLGEHIPQLKTPQNIPAGTLQKHYGENYERDLMPLLLYAALILLIADWMIMIVLSLNLLPLARFAAIALVVLSITPAHASDMEYDLKYSQGLYLAYIETGDPSLNTLAQNGLENLVSVLERRTSVEPQGVVAVNPETDTLAFFPLIYWPVSTTQKTLSPQALNNVQSYLDHGGTILFDTRDQNYAKSSLTGTPNAEALRRIVGSLNVPALEPIPDDHVLGRSFYLLDQFPGRYSGGTLWVESDSAGGRDGVSSVIIGSHDWAGAWASERSNRSSLSGGSRQQELAYRFGVNVMIYALTGNYKADQVHVPYILERLGQ